LLYDEAHEKPEGELTGRVAKIYMQNRFLDLSGLPSSTDTLDTDTASHEVFDLGAFTFRNVPRDLLDLPDDGEEAPAALLSRTTLARGEIFCHREGGRWKIGGLSNVPMSTAVGWRLEGVTEDHLMLNLQPLNEDGFPQRTTLYPRINPETRRNEIHLWLYHTTKREIPPKLPPPSREPRAPEEREKVAEHFSAFYALLGHVVPVFERLRNEPAPEMREPDPSAWSMRENGDGINDVTCYDETAVAGDDADLSKFLSSGDEVACIVVRATAAVPREAEDESPPA
jgi:hypothetical protein